MDMLPMAMILAQKADRFQAHSALPNAPVVPDRPQRVRAVRPRTVLARGLERAAQAIAPPAPTSCTTAR